MNEREKAEELQKAREAETIRVAKAYARVFGGPETKPDGDIAVIIDDLECIGFARFPVTLKAANQFGALDTARVCENAGKQAFWFHIQKMRQIGFAERTPEKGVVTEGGGK